jgi:hypothetical protein
MHVKQEMLTLPIAVEAAMDALAEFMEKLLGLPENTLDFRDRVIRRHA